MGKALIIKGADFSQVAVDTIDIAVSQPTIAITIMGLVSITSPNGEDIYYTTDGSTPTSSSTKYTGAFSVQSGTTVKAVCYFGGNYSSVVSQLYDGTLQAPTINITNKGVVTITATDNASIRYTVNGADPTSSSGTEYSTSFNVENGDVVKAIAYLSDGTTTISSSVSSATAVVVEGIMAGKAFTPTTGGTNGVIKDDAERYISPKIPVEQGTTIVWGYTGAVYGKDFLCFFDANDTMKRGKNPNDTGSTREYVVSTEAPSATYVRFCCPMGAQYAGLQYVKVKGASTNLWTYQGEME